MTKARLIRRQELHQFLAQVDGLVVDAAVDELHQIPSDKPKFLIPPGEASKTWEKAGEIVEFFAKAGISRKGWIAAVGGGVVGDLAGFAASVFLRGIEVIQIPTTLLAMVDSAIGGKTGVDLSSGKNLAGTFWMPSEVLIDPDFLETLPDREFSSGMAEVIKYGWIGKPELLELCETKSLDAGDARLASVILTCAGIKEAVVAEDPHEKLGRRAILNFGHTLGHAVEWASGLELSHGECVSIGMVWELKLAEKLNLASTGSIDRAKKLAVAHNLPTEIPKSLKAEQLIQLMKRDKKAHAGRFAFSLVSEPGTCKLYEDVPELAVRELLADTCDF